MSWNAVDVYDMPVDVILSHWFSSFPSSYAKSQNVSVKNALPIFSFSIEKTRGQADSRVVDQYVDGPNICSYPRESTKDVLLFSYIAVQLVELAWFGV